MSELRWWLLILGAAFFAGLTLWELRRPRQARDREAPPEATRPPREPSLQLPEMHALESLTGRDLPVLELPDDSPVGFPVLEPAAEAASEPAQDRASQAGAAAPLPAESRAAGYPIEAEYAATAAAEIPAAATPVGPGVGDELPELPAAPAPRVEWPPDAERRVVALRLVAPLPERFAGRSLRQALAAEGFVLGRFDIFHKGDETQRAVLSAASLTRPGTFDPQTMDSQHFGGLSLFAVLPGPMSPPQAFEELVATARNLNDRLCGVLQDEAGTPLTPARIASLRERFASGALS
jgi:cell division protein ZipA